MDSEIYHPAKFHRPMSTHARDIRNHVTKVLRTNKQTVNDISTTCLSARVYNKYASCPDWRISPHADRRHDSCKRYFRQCIFKYKIQNTLYVFMLNILRQLAVTVYDTGRHREIQIVYNTGRQRPCGGLFLTAHTFLDGRASLSHRADDRRTCYRFFDF